MQAYIVSSIFLYPLPILFFALHNHAPLPLFFRQFVGKNITFSSAVSFPVVPFAEVVLCQLIALDLAMRL